MSLEPADPPASDGGDPPEEQWSFIASTALVIALAYRIAEKAPEVSEEAEIIRRLARRSLLKAREDTPA
jgi:hypothetical protein